MADSDSDTKKEIELEPVHSTPAPGGEGSAPPAYTPSAAAAEKPAETHAVVATSTHRTDGGHGTYCRIPPLRLFCRRSPLLSLPLLGVKNDVIRWDDVLPLLGGVIIFRVGIMIFRLICSRQWNFVLTDGEIMIKNLGDCDLRGDLVSIMI